MDTVESKDSETNIINLRREARRKKILESAKTRLEKLNGKAQESEGSNADLLLPETLEYSDPEVEPDIKVAGGHFFQDGDFNGFNATFFSTMNGGQTATTQMPQNMFVKSKAYIFVASIIGYVLSLYVHNNPNSIINAIVPMALLFTGASLGNKIKHITGFLSISQSLLVSLAINIFCICVGSYVFQNFTLNHVVDIK